MPTRPAFQEDPQNNNEINNGRNNNVAGEAAPLLQRRSAGPAVPRRPNNRQAEGNQQSQNNNRSKTFCGFKCKPCMSRKGFATLILVVIGAISCISCFVIYFVILDKFKPSMITFNRAGDTYAINVAALRHQQQLFYLVSSISIETTTFSSFFPAQVLDIYSLQLPPVLSGWNNYTSSSFFSLSINSNYTTEVHLNQGSYVTISADLNLPYSTTYESYVYFYIFKGTTNYYNFNYFYSDVIVNPSSYKVNQLFSYSFSVDHDHVPIVDGHPSPTSQPPPLNELDDTYYFSFVFGDSNQVDSSYVSLQDSSYVSLQVSETMYRPSPDEPSSNNNGNGNGTGNGTLVAPSCELVKHWTYNTNSCLIDTLQNDYLLLDFPSTNLFPDQYELNLVLKSSIVFALSFIPLMIFSVIFCIALSVHFGRKFVAAVRRKWKQLKDKQQQQLQQQQDDNPPPPPIAGAAAAASLSPAAAVAVGPASSSSSAADAVSHQQQQQEKSDKDRHQHQQEGELHYQQQAAAAMLLRVDERSYIAIPNSSTERISYHNEDGTVDLAVWNLARQQQLQRNSWRQSFWY